jgi:hypothetical protein
MNANTTAMNANSTAAPAGAMARRDGDARAGRFQLPFVLRLFGLGREQTRVATADHDFLGQVQRQTHVNMTGLLERCLSAALDAKPARQDASATAIATSPRTGAPRGYRFFPVDADVTEFLQQRSRWSVLGLACHVEAPTQSRAALEWMRENARLDAAARNAAVNDLIVLMQGIDMLLVLQADWDVDCVAARSPTVTERDLDALRAVVLRSYRQRHIAAGMHRPQFARLLATLITSDQAARIRTELEPMLR